MRNQGSILRDNFQQMNFIDRALQLNVHVCNCWA